MSSVEKILAALPHRYPFLLVDGIDEVTDDFINAYKFISFNEPHFNGHFPQIPVMPGVLIVEALAQAAGIFVHHAGSVDPQKDVMLFMSITNAKFRKMVRPGDRLDLKVKPLRRGKVWRFQGKAMVGNDLAAEAEFIATIAPRSSTKTQ